MLTTHIGGGVFRARSRRSVRSWHKWGLILFDVADEETKQAYREAYDAWQKQLAALHEVFLEGKRPDPIRLKGLLNRESRMKRRYDSARLRLLGIEEEDITDDGEDEDE